MPAVATLFLNRNSGPRAGADDLIAAANAAGIEVVELSSSIDCAREIAARRRQGVRLFIAAGGDGTIHHVVQGVAGTDAVLAVIPAGTYNHFARDLGIPLDWKEALDVALNGETRQVDTGRVNDRYFVNNISLGLYPDLVARREARGRDYPRWKARLHAFYATMRRYRHVTLVVESETVQEVIRTHVFMISNNSYDLERVGVEAPRETLTAGKLSVYWLEHTTRFRLARMTARYVAGRVSRIEGFRSFHSAALRVQSTHGSVRIGIDGELLTMTPPLEISIVPRSLSVRVPAPAPESP
jgi:YegS/Rv2252/BmrU family lipid kinase